MDLQEIEELLGS